MSDSQLTSGDPNQRDPLDAQATAAAWQRAGVDWLANLSAPRTRQAYREAWLDFLKFCPKPPQNVTQSDVLAYRNHLENAISGHTKRPYSRSTINQRLSALSSFYAFAQGRKLREDNPVDGVKRMAVSPYGKAKWLDGHEREDVRLLQTVDTGTLQGKRDFALLLLFLTTALRVNAVANLRVRDVYQRGKKTYITYINKGGERVEKQLEPLTVDAINAYLQARGPYEDDAPLFIPTARGRLAISNLPHTDQQARAGEKPLSVHAINKLVVRYCNLAFGEGHGITPHSLRHTAAMNAVHEGANVLEVSSLLKHKNVAVTTVYLHATDQAGNRASRKLGARYRRYLEDPFEDET